MNDSYTVYMSTLPLWEILIPSSSPPPYLAPTSCSSFAAASRSTATLNYNKMQQRTTFFFGIIIFIAYLLPWCHNKDGGIVYYGIMPI